MTLALFHVFRHYDDLRDEFVKWIFNEVNRAAPPGHLSVRVQVRTDCGDENVGITGGDLMQADISFSPDSEAKRVVLLLENKFFADLTERQPQCYFEKAESGLVFIALKSRIPYLRSKCENRCGPNITRHNDHFDIGGKFVYFLSWERLLEHLASGKNLPPDCLCDISQLPTLFGKMARTFLRHIRVRSLAELKARILTGTAEINAAPVIHRWKEV